LPGYIPTVQYACTLTLSIWEGGDVVEIMWLTGSAPAGTVHGRTGTVPVRLSQVTRGQMRRPGRLPYFLFIAPAVVCSDQCVLLLQWAGRFAAYGSQRLMWALLSMFVVLQRAPVFPFLSVIVLCISRCVVERPSKRAQICARRLLEALGKDCCCLFVTNVVHCAQQPS
jgi:hypothetical protein